jgi:uncharacterized protein with PQ loop repeat
MLMALAPLLQVREIRRRRSSAGVSIAYFCVLLVGFALWIAYGVARRDVPLVVPNSVAFVIAAVTIGVAQHYRRTPRRDGAPPAT